MNFLLDTNVVSEWVKPRPNANVMRWLAGVATALCSDRYQGRQCRDAMKIWTENLEKTACMARDDGLASLGIHLRLSNLRRL